MVCRQAPDFGSHTRRVQSPSPPPVTTARPSRENCPHVTAPPCPVNTCPAGTFLTVFHQKLQLIDILLEGGIEPSGQLQHLSKTLSIRKGARKASALQYPQGPAATKAAGELLLSIAEKLDLHAGASLGIPEPHGELVGACQDDIALGVPVQPLDGAAWALQHVPALP